MDNRLDFDGRKVDSNSMYTLRLQIVRLHEAGHSGKGIAQITGLTEECVSKTLKKYREKGLEGLIPQKRGRRFGTQRVLNQEQEEKIRKILEEKTPDQVNLPFPLWSRDNIAMLIEDIFGLKMALRTITDYLKRWSFSYQCPLKRSYAQQPEPVKKWLNEEYPELKKQAKAEQATMFWCDETGIQNSSNGYRGFSPIGKTPVLGVEAKKMSINMISGINNAGQLRFMMYLGTMTSEVFIEFMRRMLPKTERKVYLIVDNMRVHHSKKVDEWLKKHETQMRVIYLPAYSPDLNPDEYLNNHLKKEMRKRGHARSQEELESRVRRFMSKLKYRAKVVRNYFEHPSIAYAA
jgi:transposase